MSKRAATTSEKAIAVAAIATAEALEDSQVEEPEPIQATVPKAKPPALTAAADIDDIEWTEELTWTLVTRIQDSDNIREGLLLAKANMTVMGETGAVVGSAEEIYGGTALGTKWDEIRAESPWFFEMCQLIVSRPNLQPVGLGNNDTDSDLYREISSDNSKDDPPRALAATSNDDDLPPAPTLASVKPKHSDSEDDAKLRTTCATAPAKKKTKPRPSMSAPAAAAPVPAAPAKKGTKAKDRFEATVLTEEETAQKLLGLKREKFQGQKEVQLAKIRTEVECHESPGFYFFARRVCMDTDAS
ncbi:hypothetical protein B0H14DRAFT_3503364 [Mycena olivaceomarginata]|nr:hypothetical protein B0H14DRAFT_3503364 [Mycena olivaceomarginata]